MVEFGWRLLCFPSRGAARRKGPLYGQGDPSANGGDLGTRLFGRVEERRRL